MTNKEAMALVLTLADLGAQAEEDNPDVNDVEATNNFEAIHQMQDYYNDVMEDDLIITQGDKKLKEMLEE